MQSTYNKIKAMGSNSAKSGLEHINSGTAGEIKNIMKMVVGGLKK